jgi:hypothetical protein
MKFLFDDDTFSSEVLRTTGWPAISGVRRGGQTDVEHR